MEGADHAASPARRTQPGNKDEAARPDADSPDADKLACLAALEKKALWLSTWMIHNANHLRPSRDGLKVGGHQASSASVATLMTALYLDVMQPQDRVAVKPHAAPVFHALQYLLGRQSRDKLERFRGFGGAQSYPSRTKDGADIVDFSTGSVGLGVGITLFASLVQDYLRLHRMVPTDAPPGRMIALAGDAELDEGNIFEALLEGWKHDVRNLWWIIDYNRQSLDAVVSDRLFGRIDAMFEMFGWRVVTLKYGRLLQAAFARPDGEHLREWIDACPNSLYSALVYKGGEGWREHLRRDLNRYPGIRAILDEHDDPALARLMTNLAGHDLGSVLDAFHAVTDDQPTCFIAYTIKGYGLPFAGHKDNHAGLMNPDQMAAFRTAMGVPQGAEWEKFAGLDLPPSELARFPRRCAARARRAAQASDASGGRSGRVAGAARRPPIHPGSFRPHSRRAGGGAERARGTDRDDLAGCHRLDQSRRLGQPPRHLRPQRARRYVPRGKSRLGAALGDVAARPASRARHRRKQSVPAAFGARFCGAAVRRAALADRHPVRPVHQARPRRTQLRPLSGCAVHSGGDAVGADAGARGRRPPVDHRAADRYRPARARRVRAGLCRRAGRAAALGMAEIQREDGRSVYFRLSTRPLDQPDRAWTRRSTRQSSPGLIGCANRLPMPTSRSPIAAQSRPRRWRRTKRFRKTCRAPGCWRSRRPERFTAIGRIAADRPAGTAERLLARLRPGAALVTVTDGHPATLSWLGAVARQPVVPLGVDRFGQSGDIPDLYREYGIDREAIIDAAARACLRAAAL